MLEYAPLNTHATGREEFAETNEELPVFVKASGIVAAPSFSFSASPRSCIVFCKNTHHVADSYSVLQCVAMRCSALQCIAVRCSALQCVAVHCSAWQCVAVRHGSIDISDLTFINVTLCLRQLYRVAKMHRRP